MSTTTPASSQSLTGLTDKEAQEFHKIFITSFAVFTAIAVFAHLLVWIWRPWIPGPDGYASLEAVLSGNAFAPVFG